MSELENVLNYQETDKKLYAIERELASCDERKKFVQAKKYLESASEKLDLLDAKAQQLESVAKDLNTAYEKVVSELADFDNIDELLESDGANVPFYQKKASALMDELKKVRADFANLTKTIEKTGDEYKLLRENAVSVQKQGKEAQEKYAEIKKAKDPEKSAIEKELETLRKDIPAPLMEKYLAKRKEKIFPVFGELNGDSCPFCSMQQPLASVAKLSGGATIECDSCHRFLFKSK